MSLSSLFRLLYSYCLLSCCCQLCRALAIKSDKLTFQTAFGPQKMRWQYSQPQSLPTSKEQITLSKKPPLVCIHGFGGNADQFRKNLPAFSAQGYDAYAIDLLGYGYSDKPNPKQFPPNEIYNFENWGDQINQFIEQQVKEPAVLICNSVGGVAGLQAACVRPDLVKGIVLSNISLRLLHTKKQNPLQRPFTSALQTLLRESNIGKLFFKRVATPEALRNILNVAYGYSSGSGGSKQSVDEETVQCILQPGLQPGAVEVFLDFISYSGGPLPEELLPLMQCPVQFLWGDNDPWEPIEMGRAAFADFPCVNDFVTMPGGGHCPMDQIPEVFNSEVLKFTEAMFCSSQKLFIADGTPALTI